MFDYFQLSNTTDYQYFLSQMGTDVTINLNAATPISSTPVKVLITNTDLEQNYDDKRISSLTEFKRGDIINYNEKDYIIFSEVNGKRYNKYKGIMRNLPFSITFNSSCVFITQNAYIESQNFGVSNNQVVTLADANIDVILSDSINVSGLKINDRFILLGQAFKIVGKDRYLRKGILILSCEKDTINLAIDDLVNGIAGGLACPVDITNTETSVYIGFTLQLTWTSTGAPVVFVSSDETIATVSSTGLVTGVSGGTATITISNATNGHITDTIFLTVSAEPQVKTITITGDSTLFFNQSKNYTATVFQGATQITEDVTWSIFADDQTSTTTLATITSQTGTSATVQGNPDTIGYVQLKAVLNSDNAVLAWKRIHVESFL